MNDFQVQLIIWYVLLATAKILLAVAVSVANSKKQGKQGTTKGSTHK